MTASGDVRDRLLAIVHSLYGVNVPAINFADPPMPGRIDGADSVAVLRLVLAIEQEFGIVIHDEEIQPATFASIGELAFLIQQKFALAS